MDELERIRRSIDALSDPPGWDWNSFASTLIATLVGALAAGIVTIWVLRRQRRDQYEAAVRDAAVTAMNAVLVYNRARFLGSKKDAQVDANDMEAHLGMLRAIVNKDDRPVAQGIQRLTHEAVKSDDGYAAGYAIGWVTELLANLVRRELPIAKQVQLIEEQHERLRQPPASTAD